ncbi:MAG: hypothetical protein JWQ49_3623 [Edaphobacter sp.]|nr:hypothetical protein [Edaphobacter sp.]
MTDERKLAGATLGPEAQRPVRTTPPGGPSGINLNRKPQPTCRGSKRGGMIVMGVLLVTGTLIVYGMIALWSCSTMLFRYFSDGSWSVFHVQR